MTATSADDTLNHPCMDVSVVIPAYNEARRLPVTLAGWHLYLSSQPFSSEVIVVDDGSRDATSEVATEAGARVLALRPNRGKGGAVKSRRTRRDGRGNRLR